MSYYLMLTVGQTCILILLRGACGLNMMAIQKKDERV